MTEGKKGDSDLKVEILNAELDNLTSLYLNINEEMNFSSFLDALLDNLRDIVRFDGANVAFIDDNGIMTIHKVKQEKISPRSRLSSDYLEKIYADKIDYKTGELLACICARERRELYYPEIDPDDFSGVVKERILNYGITSLYYLPIISRQRVLGVMRFHNYSGTMYLEEFEKKLIRRRVAVVARAMENFLLYDELKKKNQVVEEDLELARKLQQNMLPSRSPDIPGVDIVFRYLPMHDVGGDFIDFIHPVKGDEKALGVLVTDASGHGVSAAFVVSMLKAVVGSEEMESLAGSPSDFLQNINKRIYDKIAGNFVTAAYCYINPLEKKLILSSAGHNDTLVIDKKSGELTRLNPRGRPLGLFNDIEIDQAAHSSGGAMRIIMYTDGLTEAINEQGEEFEKTFLRLSVSEINMAAEEFTEKVFSMLFDFMAGGRKSLSDDAALVVVDIN